MSWNFARVNGKLAEVFFKRRGKVIVFQAFCYVKKSEYRTKREQNWIKPDWAIVRTGKILE